MRILVATTQVPFVRGGAEILADGLVDELRALGHAAELVAVPFKWYPTEVLLDHMLACQLLDLSEVMGQPVDRVIALRFPAYLMAGSNMTLWMLHQHRTAYELWEHPRGDLAHDPQGRAMRAAIVSADRRAMRGIQKRFVISENVADRLTRFTGLEAEVLYPPPARPDRFHCQPAEPFIFFPSRISLLKRQGLAVEAMALAAPGFKLVLAGAADSPGDLRDLQAAVDRHGLHDRIEMLGAVTEARLVELYARCSAVLFPTSDEDYGLITAEAMLSSKPVITCTDSGAPLELVVDVETGHVVAPDAPSLAAALDRVMLHPERAASMGRAGRTRLDELGINWPSTLERLLG